METFINSVLFTYIKQPFSFFLHHRTTQHEKAECKKAASQQKEDIPQLSPSPPIPSTPTSSGGHTPSGHTGNVAVTPPSSSYTSKHGCGRPQKTLEAPTFDDKPEKASREEILKWQKKRTQQNGDMKN